MALLIMLLTGGWLLLMVGLWTTARMLLQPPRMTAGKAFYLLKRATPDDLGLAYQAVEFTVRDVDRPQPIKLAGWWMPHPAGGSRTVVLIHGYADAKVGAIAWAPLWQRLGFNVLAYDQRAHGESGGKDCTGGVREADDLSQVLAEIHVRWPTQTQTLVLFGISLGAWPAAVVASDRTDIQAVVLECPFSSYPNAVRGWATQLNLPLKTFLPVTLRIAGWMARVNWNAVQDSFWISRSNVPVLVIAAENDPFVSDADAAQVQRATENSGDPSRYWRVPGSTHLRAMEQDPAAYQRVIADFLDSLEPKD